MSLDRTALKVLLDLLALRVLTVRQAQLVRLGLLAQQANGAPQVILVLLARLVLRAIRAMLET